VPVLTGTGEAPESALAAVGRRRTAEDVVRAAPVASMMATLDRPGPPPAPGDPIPPLWHGLFCTPALPPTALGADGMARDDPLLPTLPDFPRRRFGEARFRFLRPIRIGEPIRRVSEISGFAPKAGSGGRFLRMSVRHTIEGPGGPAAIEDDEILYLPRAAAPRRRDGVRPAPEVVRRPAWSREVRADPVLLFRHSALTFNAHRIHYDRDYARAQGEPGLVVQGMLIARLMLEMVRAELPGRSVAGFSFRSRAPVHDVAPFTLCGAPEDGPRAALWARRADGVPAMTAAVDFGAPEP